MIMNTPMCCVRENQLPDTLKISSFSLEMNSNGKTWFPYQEKKKKPLGQWHGMYVSVKPSNKKNHRTHDPKIQRETSVFGEIQAPGVCLPEAEIAVWKDNVEKLATGLGLTVVTKR